MLIGESLQAGKLPVVGRVTVVPASVLDHLQHVDNDQSKVWVLPHGT